MMPDVCNSSDFPGEASDLHAFESTCRPKKNIALASRKPLFTKLQKQLLFLNFHFIKYFGCFVLHGV